MARHRSSVQYKWLARQNARVYPRQHGLLFDQECCSVWVAGEKEGVPIRRGDTRVCQIGQRRSRVEEPPTDDYGMRTEVFEECTRRLKLIPSRYCFASPDNRKSDRYYSSEEDALSEEWDPNEVLWIVTGGPPSEAGITGFLGVPPIRGVFSRVIIINRFLIFVHP